MSASDRRTWVVVGDAAHARIYSAAYKRQEGLQMEPISEMEAKDVHGFSRDLKSDRPGRGVARAASSERHAMEPHHDYHKLEKHKFTARVAKILDEARAANTFDEVILVMPRRSIGELRTLLSDRVRVCVRAELAKDLTKVPAKELWEAVTPLLGRPKGTLH